MNNWLLDLLSAGGYILYARHGEATVGEDQPDMDFRYCCTQRNLSELGKRQAICYGQILRNLRVPIDYPVLTSPFCRTIETAQLAFGTTNIQVDPFLYQVYRLSTNLSSTEQRIILNSLQSILENIPLSGNMVIIAHNLPEGTCLDQIPYMGTAIVRPKGQGNGYEVIATLSLTDLLNLETII